MNLSAISIKYRNLCSAIIIVAFFSFHLFIIAFNISIVPISKLEDGSSNTYISGSITAAEAQAIFCFSPPDIENKFLSSKFLMFNSCVTFPILVHISSRGTSKFSQANAISLVESTLKNCVLGF